MGATNFETIIYTTADMETAYRQAVKEALFEDGHEPYNGTISTTSGVALSPLARGGKPVREDQIDYQEVMAQLDHLNKWEHCEALPILRVEPAKTESVGMTAVEAVVPSEALDRDTPNAEKMIVDAATKQVRKLIRSNGSLQTGPIGLKKAVPTPGNPRDYTVQVYAAPRITQKPKVTTRATKGKTETRYFVLREGDSRMPDWDSGFASQAEARAALPTTFGEWGTRDTGREAFSIISMTRRVGGQPLVEHTMNALSAATTRVNLPVYVDRVVTPAKPTSERGWLFYGWAAF